MSGNADTPVRKADDAKRQKCPRSARLRSPARLALGWNKMCGGRLDRRVYIDPVMTAVPVLSALCCAFSLVVCSARDDKKTTMETSPEMPANPSGKGVKSDAEWKKLLSPEQYRILREAGTEAPNGALYKEFKHQGKGTYHCAGCGALLFSSDQKI